MSRTCDARASGYFNLSAVNPSGCTACDCPALGTAADSVCDAGSGQCVCLEGFTGQTSGQCASAFCVNDRENVRVVRLNRERHSGSDRHVRRNRRPVHQYTVQNVGGQRCDQ